MAQKIIELVKKHNFKHNIYKEDWSYEIIDMIYDSIPDKYKNHPKYPSLLLLSTKNYFRALINMAVYTHSTYSELIYTLYFISFIISIFSLHSSVELQSFFQSQSIILYHFFNIIAWLFIFCIITFVPYVVISLLLTHITDIHIVNLALKIDILQNKKNSRLSKWIFLCHSDNYEIWNFFSPIIIRLHLQNHIIERIKTKTHNLNVMSPLIIGSLIFDTSFKSCYFKDISFVKCGLIKIIFLKSTFSILHFENSILVEIDFSHLTYIRRGFRQSTPCLTFLNSQIDDFTIKSLSRCIVSNKLEIGKDVVADEWLEKRLSEEVAELQSEASNL